MNCQYRPSPAAPRNNTLLLQSTQHPPPLGPLGARSFLSQRWWGLHTLSEGYTPTSSHLIYNENDGQHVYEAKVHRRQYVHCRQPW